MSSHCCKPCGPPSTEPQKPKQKKLVIIGGGSAAFSAAIRASSLGAAVTIINSRLPMGGCCVNVGCVPSKTLIRAAEKVHCGSAHTFKGIRTSGTVSNFKEIIRQKDEMVLSLRKSKYQNTVDRIEACTYVNGVGELLKDGTIRVCACDGSDAEPYILKPDCVIIATGVRPSPPPFMELNNVPYFTNESLFDKTEMPTSLIVIGGRFVALECAQAYSRFGSRVTVLQRSSHIIPDQDEALSLELEGYLKDEGITVVTSCVIDSLSHNAEEGLVSVVALVQGERRLFSASHLLVAAGRCPNVEQISGSGIELSSRSFVRVDEKLQTSIPNVYAAGDVIGGEMFVYTAAEEGSIAAANALGDSLVLDRKCTPWVMFTDPQVAGVGLNAKEAAEQKIDVDVSYLPLTEVPRSIAARDTRGSITLFRDSSTHVIVGARILAPEGSELLMEVSLAIKHHITSEEVAATLHPYLTLSEGIRLAAIAFDTPVSELSCCASI